MTSIHSAIQNGQFTDVEHLFIIVLISKTVRDRAKRSQCLTLAGIMHANLTFSTFRSHDPQGHMTSENLNCCYQPQ